jgi:lipopolysaccharide export system protein LptA
MKRSEAARYARWSAILALTLAGITVGIYMHRRYVAIVEKRHAPPPLAQNEEKRSISLTFSKVDTNRTVFTVQASKSTDLRGQDISLLEDVKITVFGKAGDRNDVIHTQSCRYAKADGAIQCDGNVVIDLQSAADAVRDAGDPHAVPNVIHVETTGVTFEKATGRAQTVQPVKFSFVNGNGEGVGAVYFSEEGRLRLVRDVRIAIQPTEEAGCGKGRKPGTKKEVVLRGSSLEMEKLSKKIVLMGPATATTSEQELKAGELDLLLDAQNRAQTVIAVPGTLAELPEVTAQGAKGPSTLQAERLTANLTPAGWIRTIEAENNVHGTSANGEFRSKQGEVEMWPQVNQARLVTLRGSVKVDGRDPQSGNQRHLATDALQLNFAGGKPDEPSRMQHAETLSRGTMEWTDTGGVRSKMAADKLALDFAATKKAQQLVATGGVQTERELTGRPLQTATASRGDAQLDAAGEWSQITLHGKVHLKEGEKNAEADQAVFVKASETSVLTGQAMVRDEGSETRAAKITFHQATGDIEAEGKVRSTDFSAKNSSVQLSPAPSNISSEHMQGNSKSGRALYTGHARLWQGPSVMEADSIELLRDTRVLNAKGNVRGVFPQQEGQKDATTKQPSVCHFSSGTLTFWDLENRAHLEKDVMVQSADQRMRGPVLDLYFIRAGNGKQGSEGGLQLTRAVGTGGVVVEQGDRRGTAEHGVYVAEEQKFVLSGGTPTLYDATEGTTTGRELTFNIADDTIIVDSGNGTRTLTKHRVQR